MISEYLIKKAMNGQTVPSSAWVRLDLLNNDLMLFLKNYRSALLNPNNTAYLGKGAEKPGVEWEKKRSLKDQATGKPIGEALKNPVVGGVREIGNMRRNFPGYIGNYLPGAKDAVY